MFSERSCNRVTEQGFDVTDFTYHSLLDPLATSQPAGVEELIVTNADLLAGALRDGGELHGLVGIESEWLFHIDMAA